MIASGFRYVLGTFLAMCAIAALASPAYASKRIALIIGNSEYTTISRLANPRNDARLMAKTLESVGFEVVTAVDATRVEMGRAIRKFRNALTKAGPDAVGLFFFAGHGVQALGGNYLIPIGATIESDADLEIEALSTAYIMRQFERAGNRLNLLVLDACRNNPFKGQFRNALRGLQRIEHGSGAMIAFSAGPGQAALDGKDDNSPYTKALVKAMQVPGLKVEEVFKRVRIEVERETGGAQTPWEESSLRGEFYFKPAENTVVDETTVTDPITTATDPLKVPGRDTWTAIQNTRSKAVLRTFVAEYPDSIYAKFARARLAELQLEDEKKQKVSKDRDQEQAERKRTDKLAALKAELEKERLEKERIKRDAERKLAEEKKRREQERLASLRQEEDFDPKLPRKIQRALRRAGCDPGTVDGVWGTKSTSALRRFTRYANVDMPDKHISRETLHMILKEGRGVCPKPKTQPKQQTVEKKTTRTSGTNPTSQDYYGAIAYSQTTDAHGWAYDYKSKKEAEHYALINCQKYGSGCKVVTWVRNACSALAVGKGNAYGADWGTSQQDARSKALTRCTGTGARNCQIRRWVCTTR